MLGVAPGFGGIVAVPVPLLDPVVALLPVAPLLLVGAVVSVVSIAGSAVVVMSVELDGAVVSSLASLVVVPRVLLLGGVPVLLEFMPGLAVPLLLWANAPVAARAAIAVAVRIFRIENSPVFNGLTNPLRSRAFLSSSRF